MCNSNLQIGEDKILKIYIYLLKINSFKGLGLFLDSSIWLQLKNLETWLKQKWKERSMVYNSWDHGRWSIVWPVLHWPLICICPKIISNIINNTQKRFYNRETFCVIHQMSYQTPLPFYATQIINHFLNSMNKGWNFTQPLHPDTPYCFSSVESLFLYTITFYNPDRLDTDPPKKAIKIKNVTADTINNAFDIRILDLGKHILELCKRTRNIFIVIWQARIPG